MIPDFDEMVKLAKEDPEGFEKLREKMAENLIMSAPEEQRRRLRGLQWKINSHIEMSSNPMASCIKISQMMHESFHELRGHLTDLAQHENYKNVK